jgi:uncharacterized membrane protein
MNRTGPPGETASSRLVGIDALRGLALVLMALDHASFFTRTSIIVEYYVGAPLKLWSWPYVVLGMLTNVAAPTFWTLSGVSIALLEAARRRRGESQWSISRFLLIRAVILVVLDASVNAMAWGNREFLTYDYAFNVLSGLAVGMVLLSGLRFLPLGVLGTATVALLVGYQGLVSAVPEALLDRYGYWLTVWITFSERTTPHVWFPVLGWFGLMGLGYVLGRHADAPAARRPRTWLVVGAALLAAWFAIRSLGGYGNFVPYVQGEPWYYFLIMSKGPPSLDFFTFNLGLAALALAGLLACSQWLQRRPLRWLVVVGRASLFFYVVHLAVYRVLGLVSAAVIPMRDPRLLRYLATWLVGLVLLIPLAERYRRVRDRHPRWVLRYL